MKSHDFGQFLFNSSTLNPLQLSRLIKASKNSKPTLATKAIFLRLVSATELTELFRQERKKLDDPLEVRVDSEGNFLSSINFEKYDSIVKNLTAQSRAAHTLETADGRSFYLAQSLLDKGIANFIKLEHILEKYNRLEIPPFEKSFSEYYLLEKDEQKADYPFSLDAAKAVYDFLSENLSTSIILLPPSETEDYPHFGATVRINGEIPIIIGLIAKRNIFKKIAENYTGDVYDSQEDIFDVVSELLNVFTGHFTIRIASLLGVEEEPEPPRFGEINQNISAMKMLADIGTFYIYVGKEEIFQGREF